MLPKIYLVRSLSCWEHSGLHDSWLWWELLQIIGFLIQFQVPERLLSLVSHLIEYAGYEGGFSFLCSGLLLIIHSCFAVVLELDRCYCLHFFSCSVSDIHSGCILL